MNVSNPKKLPSWATLEKLPYLSAVIYEGLRLMYGAPGRLPRIATDNDLEYEGSWSPPNTSHSVHIKHTIPHGYAIGMSAYITHSDESIFPCASQFTPERWLDENGQRMKDLERYFLSFSKGSRQCLGMQ